jgi:ATP-dependent DNA ligase
LCAAGEHRNAGRKLCRVTSRFPDWLEPMAATLTQERFTGPEWIFERKFDGIRLLAFKRGRDVKLYSRNRLEQHHPAIVDAINDLGVRNVILDGEVTWGGERLAYYVFDILWLDDRDLTKLPLDERLAILKTLPLRAPLRRVRTMTDEVPWERARAEGWEGVIAKRRDAPYEHKRSKLWLKMKCEASQELVVGGFTDPKGGRKGLGALLVGYYDGDDFVFAGKVGTGLDTRLLLDLRTRFDALEIAKSPFTKGTGLPKLGVHWVKPKIVVQVSFLEWTGEGSDGKMRHSRLLGVRHDKSAREVVRET